MNLSIIIMCPEHNLGMAKTSVNSIRRNIPNCDYFLTLASNANTGDMKEYKELGKILKGKNTITSLINVGLKKGGKNWNLFIVEGTTIRRSMIDRMFSFIKNEKDILFPIRVHYDNQGKPIHLNAVFHESSINGLLIHHQAKEIGDLSDDSLEESRVYWSAKGMELGYKFKGILGPKFI